MQTNVILSINLGNMGSTGKIAYGIADVCAAQNIQMSCAYPEEKSNVPGRASDIVICSYFWRRVSRKLARITGFNGCFSIIPTLRFLRKVSKLQPELFHLHNLHHSYINLPLLFRYIKKRRIPVIWTLHDCWAFTGQCPHFTMAKCDKWKTSCYDCPQYREYPQSNVDRTRLMWKLKKKWFTGVQNMTIVTPSQWLADLVQQSFLKDYPVKVIHNGIDLNIFKPTESDFRQKHHLEDKKIVLGVAFGWGKRKGLDVFIELAKRLDERYQIILVGTDEEVDQQLPANILTIHRTHNQKELAEIYSVADVLAQPTREENYPTVNMEAIACGTPVVTFRTGGSPECLDASCGTVVDCDDVDGMEGAIRRICEQRPYSLEHCLQRAKAFDAAEKFAEYIELYTQIF